MGDVLGSIFGTSSATEQRTVPDPVQQQANRERLGQILALFQTGGLYNFSGTDPEAYAPTQMSYDINSIARNRMLDPSMIPGYNNLLSLGDYQNAFDPVTANYERSVADANRLAEQGLAGNIDTYNAVRAGIAPAIAGALGRSYGDYAGATAAAGNTYGRVTGDINNDYNAAIARGDYDLARSLITNEAYANRALGTNADVFRQNIDLTDQAANLGLQTNEQNYLRSLGIANADAARSLTTQDINRLRALQLGIGTTGNYVDLIATPRINQAMTLQGLEKGGAVPAAIARATAEQAMPYLQSIENAYGTNQANTLNNLMSLRGTLGGQNAQLDAAQLQALLAARASLGGQYAGLQSGVNTQLLGQQGTATEAAAAGNRALGGQRMQLQGQAGNVYQNNITQLAQAMMANNVTLEQAGISAESALGQQLIQAQNALRIQQQQSNVSLANTYNPLAASFAQTLPGASAQLSLLPGQLQAQDARTLTGLMPVADFPRQLREADLLRRQGLFTTAFTGIPFQAGSTTFGGTSTGNIFDQLGGTIKSGLQGGGDDTPF